MRKKMIALFVQIKKIENSNKLLHNIHFSMIYNTYNTMNCFSHTISC